MSGVTFLVDNLVDNGTYSLTAGVENLQFPLENIRNDFTTKKFRSVGNTATIVIDTLQIRTIDSFAIKGDSTDVLGVTTVSVRYSLTTDFSGSPVVAVDLSAEYNLGYKLLASGVSARYVEFSLTGNGSYAEIGKLFVGEKEELQFNSLSIQSFSYRFDDRSDVRTNDYGQRFVNLRNKRKVLRGSIENMDKTEQETMDGIYQDRRRVKPFWIILDPDSLAMTNGNYKLTMYSYFNKMPTFRAVGGQHYNADMDMVEGV